MGNSELEFRPTGQFWWIVGYCLESEEASEDTLVETVTVNKHIRAQVPLIVRDKQLLKTINKQKCIISVFILSPCMLLIIICVTNYMHLMYYHIHILNTYVKMLVTYDITINVIKILTEHVSVIRPSSGVFRACTNFTTSCCACLLRYVAVCYLYSAFVVHCSIRCLATYCHLCFSNVNMIIHSVHIVGNTDYNYGIISVFVSRQLWQIWTFRGPPT
jgi:hypothetical protein